ncbi:hypothetical protein BGX38DRAFT_1273258 [Terfezia claveryi]|nr:hypothetical protein BGX38DRAFT_1273258 [Terfezia claveryi]
MRRLLQNNIVQFRKGRWIGGLEYNLVEVKLALDFGMKEEHENLEENFKENMEVWVDNDLVAGNKRRSGEGDEVDEEDEEEIEYGDIVYDLIYEERSVWYEGESFEVDEGEESMNEYRGDDSWVLEDSDSQAEDN